MPRLVTVGCIGVLAVMAVNPIWCASLYEDAILWARSGNVQPYPLMTYPGASGKRHVIGHVYTPLARLALAAQAALEKCEPLEPQCLPSTDDRVYIAWEDRPEFEPSLCDGAELDAAAPMRVAIRPKGRESAQVWVPATLASFDESSNGALLRRFTDIYADVPICLLLRLRRSDIPENSYLLWSVRYRCSEARSVAVEAIAFASADEVRGWR